jgi:hypothetical protein
MARLRRARASGVLAGPPAPRAILRRPLVVVDALEPVEAGDLLLGLRERTVGDQHVSLAATNDSRIHPTYGMVIETSFCRPIFVVGPLV